MPVVVSNEVKAAVQFGITDDEPQSFAPQPCHALFKVFLMALHLLDHQDGQSLACRCRPGTTVILSKEPARLR